MTLVRSADPIIRAISGSSVVIIDTETSSLHPWRDGKILAGIGVRPLGGPSFYLPFRHADSDNAPLSELEKLATALSGHTLLGHHIMFDLAVLWQEGVDLVDEGTLCTVVITRLVSEDEPSYKLKLLAKKYVDHTAGESEKELKRYMRTHRLTTYDQVPAEVILKYVLDDLLFPEGLYNEFFPKIEERGLAELLRLERTLTRELFHIERVGIRLDQKFIRSRLVTLESEVSSATSRCYDSVAELLRARWRVREGLDDRPRTELEIAVSLFKGAGKTFKLQSSHDIRKIFHGLGVTSNVKTAKGNESWDKNALAIVAAKHEDEIARGLADTVIKTRGLINVKNYYENFLELMDGTGILHGSLNQAGTKTGRFSSSEPNLQNIPKPDSLAGMGSVLAVVGRARGAPGLERLGEEIENSLLGEVRGAFVPRPGCFLLLADWSQIELRILAQYSQEPEWLRAFELGLDVHALAAYGAYGSRPLDETLAKWWRKLGKEINFGIVYGIGKKKLSKAIQRSEDETRDFIYSYKGRFSRIAQLIDDVEEMCRARMGSSGLGWVRDLWGRRRYLHEGIAYKAVNFIIQGSAADLMKDTLVRLCRVLQLYETRVINVIHDEFIFEVPYSEAKAVVSIIKSVMEHNDRITVPLRADLKFAPERWDLSASLDCLECGGHGKLYELNPEKLFDLLVAGKLPEHLDAITCSHCGGEGYSLKEVLGAQEPV